MTSEIPTPSNSHETAAEDGTLQKPEHGAGDSRLNDLGGSAVLLGKLSDNPNHEIPNKRTYDVSVADFESRIRSALQVEREGLVPIPGEYGQVEREILEWLDNEAPNLGHTRFDWIVSSYPSAVFVEEDGGYRGYIDPSGPDYRKS